MDDSALHVGEATTLEVSEGATPNLYNWELPLNNKQQVEFNAYAQYLKNPNSSDSKPTPIVLVSEIGGTGKSHLIHAFVDHGKKCISPSTKCIQ